MKPIKTPFKKVALVHDWLTQFRGGERVLEQFCLLFPQAEIFTLIHTPGSTSPTIESHRIHTSFLSRLPKVEKYYRYLLPSFPSAIEAFDLSEFDLVISSSHCVAKGVIVSPQTLHLCYCHTPMRYLWDKRTDYFPPSLSNFIRTPFLHYLRIWDASSACRVDHFIANSKWVKKRIAKYYGREATVVYPPIDTKTFQPRAKDSPVNQDYYLVVSALVPYKRVELAIAACNELQQSLIVVGDGPEGARLRALAGPEIEFVGRVSVHKLRRLYSGAKALLFPGEEDFGMTPVESMACGTPVIALDRGGATESVTKETGVLFPHATVESLKQAIQKFETLRFDPKQCRRRAQQFDTSHFQQNFLGTLASISKGAQKKLTPFERTYTKKVTEKEKNLLI